MLIGICGAGSFGSALGKRLAGAGHEIAFGVRAPTERPSLFAGAEMVQLGQVLARAEVVLVALPGLIAPDVLREAGGLSGGRILIDSTNLLNADWTPANLPGGISNAERLQAVFPEARVVKAFNTVFADMLAQEPDREASFRPATFLCADDNAAGETAAGLAKDAGLVPVSAGDLMGARHLEAMAHLHIRIATAGGMGTRGGFAYLTG